MDDITTYSPPTSPGGGISLLVTNYDYTFRVYKDSSTTPFYTTQFNLANATRVLDFVTDATTTQIRIEISRGMSMVIGYTKYVDNLKLRKFTGNTSVYQTNYSNMSITANALDGWAPTLRRRSVTEDDDFSNHILWSTTSATVDQAAGQYRLVAIGSGATAKVQREFTAMPNQEHRFQYNLSLLNAGSTTIRVEQKVNGVYQYLATQQTQTNSGTYELSFLLPLTACNAYRQSSQAALALVIVMVPIATVPIVIGIKDRRRMRRFLVKVSATRPSFGSMIQDSEEDGILTQL